MPESQEPRTARRPPGGISRKAAGALRRLVLLGAVAAGGGLGVGSAVIGDRLFPPDPPGGRVRTADRIVGGQDPFLGEEGGGARGLPGRR